MTARISASIYLLKKSSLDEVRLLFQGAATLMNGLDGLFVTFPTPPTIPQWFRAVQNHVANTNGREIHGQSAGGMLLLPVAGSHYLVTFGHAWQLLEPTWLAHDFGRTVALEIIPPDKLIELNSEQVFSKFHYAKERAPRATSISEFGVEAERDLVGAVEGQASDPLFGKVVRGSTSLRVTIPISTLPSVLKAASILYGRNGYQRRHPTIDNLTQVVDVALIQTLDNLLHIDLASGAAKKNIVLIAPSFRRGDANSADAFAYGRRVENQATSPYLQYSSWEHHLARTKETPTIDLAKNTKVHMFDVGGEKFETRTVYECIGYEVPHSGESYVLSSGNWYVPSKKFIAGIDRTLKQIRSYEDVFGRALPKWDGIISEGEYNELCCKGKGRQIFDEKIVHFGGNQSKFEFCDFMDPTRNILFFAKITGRSSSSSHLVEQVRRTVELIFDPDDGFRKKLKARIEVWHPKASTTWLDSRPRHGELTLCLVSLGREKNMLPLFAKCSVSRLCRDLAHAGHPVLFEAV